MAILAVAKSLSIKSSHINIYIIYICLKNSIVHKCKVSFSYISP